MRLLLTDLVYYDYYQEFLVPSQIAKYSQNYFTIFIEYLQTWYYDWYQKFLVPPPIVGENRTKVNVSLSVTNIMDINEQVFKEEKALHSFAFIRNESSSQMQNKKLAKDESLF